MRRFLLVFSFLVFLVQVHTAPTAFVALNTATWSAGRPPADWSIKVNHGKPDLSVCGDSDSCLHLKSVKASFGLERKVDVDIAQLPWLSWKWKVTRLPADADFRHAWTDDQAAQVLLAFDDRHVLSYIWDSSAPKGIMQAAGYIPLVHIFAFVCRSGSADANQWVAESRNIAVDYEHAFGRPATRLKGLRLQINSQHTGTVAESYFGEVAFRSFPQ